MRIAICDDDRQELDALAALLEQLDGKHGRMRVASYGNALDLLHDAEAGTSFDVVIFDIMMPGLSGIDAARELRAHNEAVDIVFLTSTPEFAVESYEVRAVNYLLKPVDPDKLAQTVERIAKQLDKPRASLTLSKPQRLVTLPFDQIEYVEIVGKTLHFMLADGGEETVRAPLRDYEEQLTSQPGFFKSHRSFIVNLANMRELDGDSFVSACKRRVPVSRALRKEAREAYVGFLFEDAQLR